jgi:hypothetical protein
MVEYVAPLHGISEVKNSNFFPTPFILTPFCSSQLYLHANAGGQSLKLGLAYFLSHSLYE